MRRVKKNKFSEAEEEVKELERLLNEASERLRKIAKVYGRQGWWDWIKELIGF